MEKLKWDWRFKVYVLAILLIVIIICLTYLYNTRPREPQIIDSPIEEVDLLGREYIFPSERTSTIKTFEFIVPFYVRIMDEETGRLIGTFEFKKGKYPLKPGIGIDIFFNDHLMMYIPAGKEK